MFHCTADGDLWAKLSLGAAIWNHGELPTRDMFAFTPVLPAYVDHEWGAGLVFFTLLKLFGPGSLMMLKIVLALGTVTLGIAIARRLGCPWPALLALAVPACVCILPGYVVVIRSHAFTYVFFAATLLLLEIIRSGKRWPAFALPVVMVLWVNVHGGFVAGLGTIGIYTLASLSDRKLAALMVPTSLACLFATFVNPYGPKFWSYVLRAILHKRPDIVEWQPMPWWGMDAFIGFRILFIVTICALILGWRESRRSWPGLGMLLITAILALRSRRHAPFFGVAALAFIGPCLQAAFGTIGQRLAIVPSMAWERALVVGYAALALFVSARFLPHVSFRVLAPVVVYPVREADILARSGLSGNLAVPFMWGSYAGWRLHPKIKVSIDGRYEAAYPESTFAINHDFFHKRCPEWDRLLLNHQVDFIILDLQLCALRPEDLAPKGFSLIWYHHGASALLASHKHAASLKKAVAELPPSTIEPLNPAIPSAWPKL
ncbi:MAG: hypothetical protein L0Y58_01575 [Verrucomicrobia subdivision 3 bacterium]|nr:hypothetical protein [Limisphaerales bacterium]